MDGAGLTIGAVAGIGISAGMSAPAAMGVSPPPPPAAGMVAAAAADVVVTISEAAMQAFALDATSSAGGPSSRLADDLAALALLAILERDRQQSDPLVNAAAAIGAYMAMQALSSGG
ncbi:MAG TPA: hypothetical protein VF801_01305 [Rhodocyclaceae bacterium]